MGYGTDLIICSNLLEHLSDHARFARACGEIAKPGGYCLFTVPHSFPYHPDPLDTMYRPTPDDIAMLLPGWRVLKKDGRANIVYILAGIEARNRPHQALARQVVRALMPFYSPRAWLPAAHTLFMLFRPYRVSLVMLKKPGVA